MCIIAGIVWYCRPMMDFFFNVFFLLLCSVHLLYYFHLLAFMFACTMLHLACLCRNLDNMRGTKGWVKIKYFPWRLQLHVWVIMHTVYVLCALLWIRAHPKADPRRGKHVFSSSSALQRAAGLPADGCIHPWLHPPPRDHSRLPHPSLRHHPHSQ